MPRDPFAEIHAGDKLAGLPHAPWNAMLRGLKGRAGPPGGGLRETSVEISVRNATGAPLAGNSIVRVARPTISSTADLNEFLARDLADATPAEAGRPFAVTVRPLSVDEIGPAVAMGLCRVKVNLTHASHPFARPTASATQLASDGDGPARILWVESDATGTRATGSQWAVVLLTGRESETAVVRITEGQTGNGLYAAERESEAGPPSGWAADASVWAQSINPGTLLDFPRNYLARRNRSTYLDKEVWDVDYCCGSGGAVVPDWPADIETTPSGPGPCGYVYATVDNDINCSLGGMPETTRLEYDAPTDMYYGRSATHTGALGYTSYFTFRACWDRFTVSGPGVGPRRIQALGIGDDCESGLHACVSAIPAYVFQTETIWVCGGSVVIVRKSATCCDNCVVPCGSVGPLTIPTPSGTFAYPRCGCTDPMAQTRVTYTQ
jgi:hypothetical protein